MNLISKIILKCQQEKIRKDIVRGRIKLIDDINLKDNWIYHPLIKEIRAQILPLVQERLLKTDILFDPQDLEHQILFRLTTFAPEDLLGRDFAQLLKLQIKNWRDIESFRFANFFINQAILKNVFEEQYLIITERMKAINKIIPLDKLFRGLTGKSCDLNYQHRLKMERRGNELLATGDNGLVCEVEFKVIKDHDIITALTSGLHYIHNERSKGEVFAFFFKGDEIPWGIETTESTRLARNYKRIALLARGIHPDRAIELTRYYLLPGSPINSISIIDSLVRHYYLNQNVEALITCTMPTYAKTKSSTISGGINKLLLIKPLSHQFIRVNIRGQDVWQHATKRLIEQMHYRGPILKNHPDFPLYPTFEVYITIKETALPPLSELNNKVISYI